MVIVPFVHFIKEIPRGSTSHRLEALSLPFLVRPFPNTDPIALTPTALPPRPGTEENVYHSIKPMQLLASVPAALHQDTSPSPSPNLCTFSL